MRSLWLTFLLTVVSSLFVVSNLSAEPSKVSIALNWVPEPEFGGIYAAKENGSFAKHGLDVEIRPGGAGAPTWQRVAFGQVDFGVASADELVIARSNGADIVAIFTTYQTCPQGIMTHASRDLKDIGDVFKSGTLALEIGLPYGKFLEKKYGFTGVKRVPYTGGIANFLADKTFAQQCFVFSEPIAAKQQGADPKVFLISDSGYNPYTGVIVTRAELVKTKPELVRAMVESLSEGWRAYLDDPKSTNAVMGKLNKNMDAATFQAAAEAQKPLVEGSEAKASMLGEMTLDRWAELVKQLTDLGVVTKPVDPARCFVASEKAPAK